MVVYTKKIKADDQIINTFIKVICGHYIFIKKIMSFVEVFNIAIPSVNSVNVFSQNIPSNLLEEK